VKLGTVSRIREVAENVLVQPPTGALFAFYEEVDVTKDILF
jgi:hypothetical protein